MIERDGFRKDGEERINITTESISFCSSAGHDLISVGVPLLWQRLEHRSATRPLVPT